MLCWFKSKLVYFLLAIFFGVSFLFSEDASLPHVNSSLPANITRTFTPDARPISFSIFKGEKFVVIHSNALVSA